MGEQVSSCPIARAAAALGPTTRCAATDQEKRTQLPRSEPLPDRLVSQGCQAPVVVAGKSHLDLVELRVRAGPPMIHA